MPSKKCRLIYFEDRKARKRALKAILAPQGFSNLVEQYEFEGRIDEPCNNDVFRAVHKITGTHVVIKVICKNKYKVLRR